MTRKPTRREVLKASGLASGLMGVPSVSAIDEQTASVFEDDDLTIINNRKEAVNVRISLYPDGKASPAHEQSVAVPGRTTQTAESAHRRRTSVRGLSPARYQVEAVVPGRGTGTTSAFFTENGLWTDASIAVYVMPEDTVDVKYSIE